MTAPKFKPVTEMTFEELQVEVKMLRRSISQIKGGVTNPQVSAVDRNGKTYSRDEMVIVFERLYLENPKAIKLMFPNLSYEAIRKRAKLYGACRGNHRFTQHDDDMIRKYHPDYRKIATEQGRMVKEIRRRANTLGLLGRRTSGPLWTPEEDALLRKGLLIPGRDDRSRDRRRRRLKINGHFIRQVNALKDGELRKLVEAHVARGYPDQYRLEAVSDVIELCLQGKCGTKPELLIAAGKKAVSAVYKLHPDRGAPISMDAKLFDDGNATVGDRISSDAFHF